MIRINRLLHPGTDRYESAGHPASDHLPAVGQGPARQGSADEFQSKQAMADLRKYTTRNNARGWGALLLDWGIIAATSLLATYAFRHWSGYIFAVLYPVLTLVLASRYRALENLIHEASHYNLFATKAWNENLQFLYAFPVFRTVEDYRKSHARHHRYTGDPDKDPDMRQNQDWGLDPEHLHRHFAWKVYIRPFTLYHTLYYLKAHLLSFFRSKTHFVPKILFWALVLAGVQFSNGWTVFLLGFVLPFFVTLPIIRFYAEASEHINVDFFNRLSNSRNNVGLLHHLLLHPHNDGYHVVHHLSPSIPFFNLKKAYGELKEKANGELVESGSFTETIEQMGERSPLIGYNNKN